jgi:hypothetical protein
MRIVMTGSLLRPGLNFRSDRALAFHAAVLLAVHFDTSRVGESLLSHVRAQGPAWRATLRDNLDYLSV